MLNIISEVNKYIKTKITPYAEIRQNAFMFEGTEEIICRQEPSNAVENRYMDGSRIGGLNFAYYAKSIDQKKAREQLDSIINVLDIAGIEITDGLFIKVTVSTLPAFIQKTEAGEFIFTASFKLEYINK